MQSSRTRASLVVKRRDTRSDSASSLCEDLCRRLWQDLLERFFVEAAVQDPCVRLSVPGVYSRSPKKIFVRDPKVRSLFKLSIDDLRARLLLSSPGLHKRAPCKISAQDLYDSSLFTDLLKGSLGKTSGQDIYTRSLGKISL